MISVGLVVCSIALPISVFFSRQRIYDIWARIVSIVVCVLGIALAVLDFTFWCASIPWSSHIIVALIHALFGGVWIGLGLCILIAKPYRKVSDEKLEPLA